MDSINKVANSHRKLCVSKMEISNYKILRIKDFNYHTLQILVCYVNDVVKTLSDFINKVNFLLMVCMDSLQICVIVEVVTADKDEVNSHVWNGINLDLYNIADNRIWINHQSSSEVNNWEYFNYFFYCLIINFFDFFLLLVRSFTILLYKIYLNFIDSNIRVTISLCNGNSEIIYLNIRHRNHVKVHRDKEP